MSILYRSVAALFLFSLPALAGSSVQGINNFHQVDEHVYRGAQPTAAGFKYLATTGVRTIVDLRENGGRASGEKQLVTSLGMRYVNVPMSRLNPPTEAEIRKILALLEDATAGPVFVHCLRGADRGIGCKAWGNVMVRCGETTPRMPPQPGLGAYSLPAPPHGSRHGLNDIARFAGLPGWGRGCPWSHGWLAMGYKMAPASRAFVRRWAWVPPAREAGAVM